MSRKDVLQKLKSTLDGLVQQTNVTKAEEKEDAESTRLALLLSGLGEISESLKSVQTGKDEMLNALAQFKVEVPDVIVPEIKVPTVNIPEIKIPDIHVPAPQVTVNVPKIELPVINVPEPKVTVNVEKSDPPIIPPFPAIEMPDKMTVEGEVSLKDINPKNPLPVQVIGEVGMSGGGARFNGVMKGVDSAGGAKSVLVDEGGRLQVDVAAGITLEAGDLEIGAVEIKNGSDDTRATVTGANALKVDGSAVTQPVSATDLDVRDLSNVTDSVSVYQISGAQWSTSASQSGTWTVQPGNTQNTTAWFVTRNFKTRSDTYTSTGNGTTVNVSTDPLESFSVQVKGTDAAATTWDVRLEGSLDGTNFTAILTHTNTTGDGVVLFSGTTDSPCLYFRSRCAGLVLGAATNIVVTILGNT